MVCQAKEGHVIAMDWCEGFMDALHLRTENWDELLRTEDGRNRMFPIFAHLVDEEDRSLVGATEEQMDALLDIAAENVPGDRSKHLQLLAVTPGILLTNRLPIRPCNSPERAQALGRQI